MLTFGVYKWQMLPYMAYIRILWDRQKLSPRMTSGIFTSTKVVKPKVVILRQDRQLLRRIIPKKKWKSHGGNGWFIRETNGGWMGCLADWCPIQPPWKSMVVIKIYEIYYQPINGFWRYYYILLLFRLIPPIYYGFWKMVPSRTEGLECLDLEITCHRTHLGESERVLGKTVPEWPGIPNMEVSWNDTPTDHPCRTMGFSLTKTI